MSEMAVEALAAPLFKEAAAVLTPEAEKVLAEVRAKLAAEADRLRAELPGKAEAAAQHVHDIASTVLGRYQSVVDWVEAKLAGGEQVQQLPADRPGTVSGPAVSVPGGSVQLGTGAPDPTPAAPASQTTA